MDTLRGLTNILAFFNSRVLFLFKWAAIFCVAAMLLVILLQVLARFTRLDFSWTEELSTFFMVWVTFLVLPIASRKSLHSALTAVVDLLSRSIFGRVLDLVLQVTVILICAYCLRYSIDFFMRGLNIDYLILPLPKSAVYISLPLGFAMMILVHAELALHALMSILDRSLERVGEAHEVAADF